MLCFSGFELYSRWVPLIVDYTYFAYIKTKEFVLKKIILFNTNLYNLTTAYYQKKNKRLPGCYAAPGL